MLVVVGPTHEVPDVMKKRSDFQEHPALPIERMQVPGLIKNLQRNPGHRNPVLFVEGVLPAKLKGRTQDLIQIEMLAAIQDLPDDFGYQPILHANTWNQNF